MTTYSFLVYHIGLLPVGHDCNLIHDLQRKRGLGLLMLDELHFAKSALTQQASYLVWLALARVHGWGR